MKLRMKLKQADVQIQLGLIALGLASLTKWFLQPEFGSADAGAWADLFIGMLYGISIGLMLVGIRRKSRRD